MKKLSKSLVKKMIYEAISEERSEEFFVTVREDDKGRMKGTEKEIINKLKSLDGSLEDDDISLKPLQELGQKISMGSIDKIIREEVSRHYEAK